MFLKPRLLSDAGCDLESGKENSLLTCEARATSRCGVKLSGSFSLILGWNLSLEHSNICDCGWEEFREDPMGPVRPLASENPKTHFLQHMGLW